MHFIMDDHDRKLERMYLAARNGWLLITVLVTAGAGIATAGRAVGSHIALEFREAERSYVRYVPAGLGELPPVLVLLHGSGRDGSTMIAEWRKLADAEGILLVAPNSANPEEWSPYDDTPAFLRAVLDDVGRTVAFDRTRVYLFGHSAGAVWGLQLGLLASDEVAAVAVHAGLIPEVAHPLIAQATRKVPFYLQVGSRDPFFPIEEVKRTVGALDEAGFAVDLEVIRSHDHDYYARSKKVNQAAWAFLRQHRIER